MTSQSRPDTTTESYFVGQLALAAKRPEVAAPATIETLSEKISYLTPGQIADVQRAHAYAAIAHQGQWRRTGHKYITHPTAVAQILAESRMDHQTLMAALLHDVIEDSDTSKSKLGKEFGMPVAEIVDGVSKLSKIFSTRAEAQAENFQKMALAMAKDIRVIMVKMADRLHNMRTIGVMSPKQRQRIARETLDFYAPIANRLGIHTMKTELEELGFKALHPLRADRIGRAVVAARGNRKELMEEIAETIQFIEWLAGNNFIFMGMREYAWKGDRKSGELTPVSKSALGILKDPNLTVMTRGGDPVVMTPEIRDFLNST